MRARTIILALAVLMMAAACEKKAKLPNDYPLYVNGADAVKKTADGRRYAATLNTLTSKEVLERMLYCNEREKSFYGDDYQICALVFYKNMSIDSAYPSNFVLLTHNIDTANNRLVFQVGNLNDGQTAIEGNLFISPHFGKNLVITVTDATDDSFQYDTVAYIPNAQREAAYEQIKALWDDEDWDAMYEIFENGLQFIPCTAAEYRELQAEGRN